MKKILIIATIIGLFTFVGCERQSEIVSHNLSKEADNF